MFGNFNNPDFNTFDGIAQMRFGSVEYETYLYEDYESNSELTNTA